MKLTLDQIKMITKGAVGFTEEEEGVRFYRFTKEQEQLYKERSEDFYRKTFATAGVKFIFQTDSKKLFLKATLDGASSRKYFSFDVFANDKLVGYMDNFSEEKLPEDYAQVDLPDGEFSKEFELGEGTKTVKVYLPWSKALLLHEFSLDDGAILEPVNIDKKALVFGDSITQGYDALRSSSRYAAKITEAMGAEEINKAIGGEVFFPELASTDEDFKPNYITVAYGTNDWSKKERKKTQENMRAFYKTLSEKYPDAKIFAITPIWRKRYGETTQYGIFEDMISDIETAVADLENVILINGFDLVPKEPKYFGDLCLHPSDEGFDYYFENLAKEIGKHIN